MMKATIYGILLFLMFSISLDVVAEPTDVERRGRAYHDFYCGGCHSSHIYITEDRVITSAEKLHEWIFDYKKTGKIDASDDRLNSIYLYVKDNYYSW
ncbi:MAG: hypothetical protein GY934_06775 [Gammaproteobacteria bacterium]|nr:hypothetical protein [Gammaproteobacteria bacterium]